MKTLRKGMIGTFVEPDARGPDASFAGAAVRFVRYTAHDSLRPAQSYVELEFLGDGPFWKKGEKRSAQALNFAPVVRRGTRRR